MGRATRKRSKAGSLRPEWVWQEEPLPPGQLFTGRGRDGKLFLCQEGDQLLRLGDGIDYDLPGKLEADTLFVASGQDLFALSGQDLIAMYASDESARYPYFIHGQPLALFPTRDGMRIVHGDENEGILQNDFSEDVVSPLGDYVLAPWPKAAVQTLEAPDGGGIALAREGHLLYDGPVRKEWDLPPQFIPGRISASGDPHDPSLFVLEASRREIFVPGSETIRLPAAARDWSSAGDLFVASGDDFLQRAENGRLLDPLGPYENLQGCYILPGRNLLLATEEGLLQVSWDGKEQKRITSEPCQKIEVALLDESEAEILLDGGSTYIRGELE